MRRLLFLAVLCLVGVRLEAQVVDMLPGARVRIHPSAGADEIKGTLLSRTADSLVVATPQGVQYRFAARSIAKLEVSNGKSGSAGALKGFKWGAGISVPLSVIAAIGSSDYVHRNAYTGTVDTVKAVDPWMVGALAATVYGGIGALIGAAIGAEDWRTVSTVSPSISVALDRARLGATIRLR